MFVGQLITNSYIKLPLFLQISYYHYTPQIGQPQRPNRLPRHLKHKLPTDPKREDELCPCATTTKLLEDRIQHLGMGLLRLPLQEPWSLR